MEKDEKSGYKVQARIICASPVNNPEICGTNNHLARNDQGYREFTQIISQVIPAVEPAW